MFDLESEIEIGDGKVWTLEQGVAFCRKVEDLLVPAGFHCALGGGVLQKGESFKDLDVFVYPHKSDGTISEEEVAKALAPLIPKWMAIDHTYQEDSKKVFFCYFEGKQRVDFFLLT